jgi:hypothetical protein
MGHERTDYQPLRVRTDGEQRWAYLPHLSTTNNSRRRRNRQRWSRRADMYISRGTSPMQWQDEQQQSTPTIPVPPTSPAKSDGMWWDDDITTTTQETATANNLQLNNHTPAPRHSADVIGQYLTSVRQGAESSTQPTAPTANHRQQFYEWAERHSNADPLTPKVGASGEEPAHPPARRPLNPPPSWTAKNQRVAEASSTDIPPNIVLQQLQRYVANGRITVSQGIDDRVYLVVKDPSKALWEKESSECHNHKTGCKYWEYNPTTYLTDICVP